MKIIIDRQVATSLTNIPDAAELTRWVTAALQADQTTDDCELTVRFVDPDEGQQLNNEFRGRDYATNVLSFPFDTDIPLPVRLLGDLVVCAPVVIAEAKEQNKTEQAHWAHMIVHGTLHLLGYDHIEDADAEHMEALERKILADLGVADPYQEQP